MSKFRLRETWLGILLILFGGFGVIFNLVTKIPVSKIMREADIPSDVQLVYARFDNVELIGYDHIDRRYSPGELVPVTLYWRIIEGTDENSTLSLALINPFGDVINVQNEADYPDEILLEISTWDAAQVYAFTYELPLVRTINSRYPFSLAVNLYDETPDMRVEPLNEADNPMTVELAMGAVIHPNIRVSRSNLQLAPAGNAPSRTFGGILRMNGFGYTIFEGETTFNVDVLWEAQTDIDTDYITFMHIYDTDDNIVSQYDFQPQLPTRYWRNYEDFRLTYSVYPPETGFSPGIYSVNFGWYKLRYDDVTGLHTSINLLIESEISTYEIFQFEVDEEGVILLPTLDIEN